MRPAKSQDITPIDFIMRKMNAGAQEITQHSVNTIFICTILTDNISGI